MIFILKFLLSINKYIQWNTIPSKQRHSEQGYCAKVMMMKTSNTPESEFESIFINIWFAIQRLNKYILYDKGFLKARKPPKV